MMVMKVVASKIDGSLYRVIMIMSKMRTMKMIN